jgi:hypothetical protein
VTDPTPPNAAAALPSEVTLTLDGSLRSAVQERPFVNEVTLVGDLRSAVEEKKVNLDELKAKGAALIAQNIVSIFALTLAACFLLVTLVLSQDKNPQDTQILLTGLASAFKGIGEFSASVFASLLAFVLGYYFGERK